mgnify:CR=1 FL=1
MALEGNAKDFGLSEIFQLISIQKKSGMLSVSGDENMAIFFKEGMIVSTRDRRAKTRDPLRDYLLRYGFIGRDEMNNLQQIQARSKMDLTDILISEKYFSEDELSQIFTEQIYETVQNVLSWPSSYYKFVTGGNVLSGVRSFASIKVEGLLMESMRRIDEFPEMKRIFHSEDMMVARLPRGKNPPAVERNEEILYDMLTGEKRIRDLVATARMARFCTYEALKGLLEKGLLEITVDARPVVEEEEEEDRAVASVPARKKLAPTIAVVTLLIACFALGEYVVPSVLSPGWSAESFSVRDTGGALPADGAGSADLAEFRLHRLEAALRQNLEEYYAARGSYPFTLEILAVKKFVSREIISRAHQYGVVYSLEGDGEGYTMEFPES